MIKVTNEVKIYEVDGGDVPAILGKSLVVESHWNNNERVNLCINAKVYTVIASDLKAAIENATNTRRF